MHRMSAQKPMKMLLQIHHDNERDIIKMASVLSSSELPPQKLSVLLSTLSAIALESADS